MMWDQKETLKDLWDIVEITGKTPKNWNIYFYAHTRTTWQIPSEILSYTQTLLLLLIICTACPATTWLPHHQRDVDVRPPGNLDRGQSFTIWPIVCFAAPQLQDGPGILRQRARFAAHCPWPVLKWFNFVHRCRGTCKLFKPGGTAVTQTNGDDIRQHALHFCPVFEFRFLKKCWARNACIECISER